MTARNERSAAAQPQLSDTLFEEIARLALHDDVRLEFINGKMWEKPVPDGDHDTIIAWLTRICIQARPELWFYAERGMKIETYRRGRARPDGVLAPEGAYAGHKEWSSPEGTLMAVEVTSYDPDADARTRLEKPRAYAEAGIPVYLLIDRDSCEVVVHSEPDGARYETIHRRPFGKQIDIPAPVNITLNTEPLTNWVS